MRRGNYIVTAAVVIFSTAALRCGSSTLEVRVSESPEVNEVPAAPPAEKDEDVEAPESGSPPPLSECAGLPIGTPAAPSGWTSELLPLDYGCGYGTTDGLGNVILLADHGFHGHETRATILTPDGIPINTYSGNRFQPIGQPSGFIGTNLISYAPYWVTALSHTGAVLQELYPPGMDWPHEAADPTGGIVVLAGHTLTAYDATGLARWSTPVPLSGPFRALGVDRQGHTLVLADGDARYGTGSLEGFWIDPSGHARAPFLAAQKPPMTVWFELYPQAHSGLFLLARESGIGTMTGKWIAAFASLQTSASPPPAWLVSRPDKSLQVIHGGKGYALVPLPREGKEGCYSDIEVVTPSGESCATVRFSSTSKACAHSAAWIGYDGTVIHSEPGSCDELGHCSCGWKWWPGFFR